jgi:hypothetical protein
MSAYKVDRAFYVTKGNVVLAFGQDARCVSLAQYHQQGQHQHTQTRGAADVGGVGVNTLYFKKNISHLAVVTDIRAEEERRRIYIRVGTKFLIYYQAGINYATVGARVMYNV